VSLLDVAATEAMMEVEGHADHDGDDDNAAAAAAADEDDTMLEDASVAATAASRDEDMALEEGEEDHADHRGVDEEDDGVDATLGDVCAAATAVSGDVDADVVKAALEVHVVSLPYWRRCRWCACGRWVACVTKAQDATIAT
jgi:hypothetical protein